MDISVIVPFHRNLEQLRKGLNGIRAAADALQRPACVTEVIVAADGAVDDPTNVAVEARATVLRIDGPQGPAVARNRAAEIASGELLVFIDTDVVVHRESIARLVTHFVHQPDVAAAFGAYDDDPADPGFVSQARNLGHAFVHQRSRREASTFWAGLGAVRAAVFAEVGGFDERFKRPSVEDIDLGYRITAAGHRVVLDPTAQGKHLKQWTMTSSYVSDIRDRGVPWTQLLRRYGAMQNDLNLTLNYRLCVIAAYLLTLSLLGSFLWSALLYAVLPIIAALWLLDWPYYQFFTRRRGVSFALRWFPLHVLHHLCNGVSFLSGTLLYALQRRFGILLPGGLPTTPWPVGGRRQIDAVLAREVVRL